MSGKKTIEDLLKEFGLQANDPLNPIKVEVISDDNPLSDVLARLNKEENARKSFWDRSGKHDSANAQNKPAEHVYDPKCVLDFMQAQTLIGRLQKMSNEEERSNWRNRHNLSLRLSTILASEISELKDSAQFMVLQDTYAQYGITVNLGKAGNNPKAVIRFSCDETEALINPLNRMKRAQVTTEPKNTHG